MAKKQAIARRTVSLPAELDRRMEKQTAVNWSEVARAAFEAKLTGIERTKKATQAMSTGLTGAIARLKQLDAEESAEPTAQESGIVAP